MRAEPLTDCGDRRRVLVIVLAAIVLGITMYVLALSHAYAHDSWISRGGFRNAAGEWCCGDNDCFVVEGVKHVTLPIPGYRLPNGEFVTEREAMPSQDDQVWRCRRPDGSRRCFFVPAEAN